MHKTLLLFLFIFLHFANAQNPYPQDFFRAPLEIPLVLSGTFAELRSNHFHSGLDIKKKMTLYSVSRNKIVKSQLASINSSI